VEIEYVVHEVWNNDSWRKRKQTEEKSLTEHKLKCLYFSWGFFLIEAHPISINHNRNTLDASEKEIKRTKSEASFFDPRWSQPDSNEIVYWTSAPKVHYHNTETEVLRIPIFPTSNLCNLVSSVLGSFLLIQASIFDLENSWTAPPLVCEHLICRR
jgi:hypothetical protein